MSAYRFIDRERASHHVITMCRVLGVSPSGYWAWARRSARSLPDEHDDALLAAIRGAHAASRGTYGSPRVHAVLQAAGWKVGRKRIARLMRVDGLVGVHRRRRRRGGSPIVHRSATTAPDLVRRRFKRDAPDRLWLADITELPTGEGPLYLAAIVDAFSRRAVGWALADHLRTSLVLAARHRPRHPPASDRTDPSLGPGDPVHERRAR